ncbi:hypothetical protein WMF18_31200 [Sorangium sp. So ce315]|uniref:hypothetical protein n=1 Tax=Sorangium sp. So ce315 TaxID=3133299 RepID=UPI003F61F823
MPPSRSMYRSGARAEPGSRLDPTRHPVPVPSRSSATIEVSWSGSTNAGAYAGAASELPASFP